MEDYPIDFVIPWVDGSDEKWLAEYKKYMNAEGDNREIRYRDMDTLKYWFRGVEKYASWVNKIYFVTCGHLPDWLNTNNPKLKCIKHSDYIPNEYLPTFSSHTIELNMHRIPELSEHFVYFNDDTFIVKEMKREDFFVKGNPCDTAIFCPYIPTRRPMFLAPIINTAVINDNFKKKEVIRRNFTKIYSTKYGKYILNNIRLLPGRTMIGFKQFHLPVSFLKSTFDRVWEKEYDILNSTCENKFRGVMDVNQWIVKDWQICEGNFYPRNLNVGKNYAIETIESLDEVYRLMHHSKYKMLCINDEYKDDFECAKEKICESFERLLPQKSSFEK